MKKLSFMVTLILIVASLVSYAPQAKTYVHGASVDDFIDVAKSHWGRPYIEFAADAGIINGYPLDNGRAEFRPEAPVSQEESMQMIYQAVKNSGTRPELPSDLSTAYQELLISNQIAPWAYECVSFGLEYDILAQTELDGFRTPAGAAVPASREQVARWVAKAIDRDLMPATSLNYPDSAEIAPENLVYVDLLNRMKVMVGDNLGNFNPTSNIKRVEFAVICNHVYDLAESPYDISRENRSYQGTISSTNLTTRKIYLTMENGEARVVNFSDNIEIVIDGSVLYNGLSKLQSGQKVIVSWGASPQVLISTKVMLGEGTVRDVTSLDATCKKVTIRLSGGAQVYYLIDGETSILEEPKVGKNVIFIADGVKLIEITSP